MRYAKRTDKSQADIVADLRKCGIHTLVTNMGDDFPDIITGHKQWVLIEIKEPDGDVSRGQVRFIVDSSCPVGVAVGCDEAKALAVDPDAHAITHEQKNALAKWLVKHPYQESVSIKKFFGVLNA